MQGLRSERGLACEGCPSSPNHGERMQENARTNLRVEPRSREIHGPLRTSHGVQREHSLHRVQEFIRIGRFFDVCGRLRDLAAFVFIHDLL
jgi:hypothetical protein